MLSAPSFFTVSQTKSLMMISKATVMRTNGRKASLAKPQETVGVKKKETNK
jgi:hypothetical protein